MLSDTETYTKLKKDPTRKYKAELIGMLNELEKSNKITKDQYWYLYPTPEKAPRMYGSPKIHKQGTPLRPIVDYTGTIAYKVSRDLADILQPLVGKTEYHVENSKDFVKDIKQLKIEEDECFVSYDVVSLFTKTPVHGALTSIRSRLEKDKTLKKRTKLTATDIISLLKFVLETTYFQFGGVFYQQKFGVAMGSPVSPIVVNLFMEDLEQKIIATAPEHCKPLFWRRYVDDIISVVKKGKENELQLHMNAMDNSIKFTREEESEEQSIPFLDTKLIRQNGGIKTVVFRKETHTDQYLNYWSHHPLHQKKGVIKTLRHRCETITSEPEDCRKEKAHLNSALEKCGYPKWILKEEKQDQQKKKGKKKEKENMKGQVVLPYVQGVTEKLTRILKKHKISTAVKPHSTLRQLLVRPKDQVKKEDQGQVVYRIPCKMCNKAYVGETGRQLKTRIEEHKKEVDSLENTAFTRSTRKTSEKTVHKSAITDHITTTNHVIDWENTKILDRAENKRIRQVREAIWIRRTKGAINRDHGCYELSHLYDTVIHNPQQYCRSWLDKHSESLYKVFISIKNGCEKKENNI